MDFYGLAKSCAQHIIDHRNEEVTLVSHMDADGISSCAILSLALDRLGIEHTYRCVKLNEFHTVPPADNMVFSDLGSGQQEEIRTLFPSASVTIIDHHQFESSLYDHHFNPFLAGHNGGTEISGSGMSYFLARALDRTNTDLASLAVVGAVGDMQSLWGKLEGLNQIIVADGSAAGVLRAEPDLLLYGRFTRPLFKSLQYFSDPPIPGVSGNESNAIGLLSQLGIPVKDDDWRTLSDLTMDEKQALGTEMIQRILSVLPSEFVGIAPRLVFGEVYTLLAEDRYSPLRDASEFSTCLNASGRNDCPEIGVEVAKGNRGIYYDKLMSLLARHRRKLARSIEIVNSRGITKLDNLQYFDGTGIPDTLVGTIAGLLLGSEECDPYTPLIGYTPSDSNTFKVSVRCSKLLVRRDLNMGVILRNVSRKYGGAGGGHAFACGAFVPHEHITPFLDDVSLEIGKSSG